MSFEEIWCRINETTDLKKYQELADFIGVTKSNISNRKAGDIFPVDWAFKIARKYKLSTDWIMTGEGASRHDQDNAEPEIIKKIGQWIQEQERKEPGALAWFSYDFRKKYTEYDRWEKREKDSSAEHTETVKSNIA